MSSVVKKEKAQPIHVYLRIRPHTKQERDARSLSCVEILNNREVLLKQQHRKKFCFEKVFAHNSKQIDVYVSVVKPLISEVLAGYNCTVFAYGQTGTGKTYTMAGGSINNASASWHSDEDAGIIPRALAHIFEELRLQQQQEFTVRVSYLELYNEDIFDLLSDSDDNSRIRIYEDQRQKGSVIVQGIEEVTVCSKNEVYKILDKGQEKRRTAATLMNASSSRSHTVFCITVYARETTVEGEEVVKMGKLNLVDLAGSENISRSGAVDVRAREAGSINQSLLTLGRCIKALVERHPHVPYRESKLTRILQDSLGGRTKTSIIATISPASSNMEETSSTLDYAHRARNITNRPEVNQRLSKKALICQYTEEIERLRKDLHAANSKSGIYLAHENYERLIANTEYQKEELAEKIVVIRDLQSKISVLEKQRQEKEKEWEDLNASLKTAKEHLDQYTKTEKVLKEQAEALLEVVEKSTSDASKLHEKVDYFYEVSNKNQEQTNKLMNLLDDSFRSISKVTEDFYGKNYTLSETALGIIRNMEKQLESAVNSLNLLEVQGDYLSTDAVTIQNVLNKGLYTFSEDVNNAANKSKITMDDAMSCFTDLKTTVDEQQQMFKAFTLSLAQEYENMKDKFMIPVRNMMDEAKMLKEKYIQLINEIETKNTQEEDSLEAFFEQQRQTLTQIMETKRSNAKFLKNRTQEIVPDMQALEYNISTHNEALSGHISILSNIVTETNNNLSREQLKIIEGQNHLSEQLLSIANTNTESATNLQQQTETLKDICDFKLQDLREVINGVKLGQNELAESVENIHLQTSRVAGICKESIETAKATKIDSDHCIITRGSEIKKILSDELVVAKRTGETPVRTQFQYPKRIIATCLRERMLQKFQDSSENGDYPRSPLQQLNSTEEMSSVSTVTFKENESDNKITPVKKSRE